MLSQHTNDRNSDRAFRQLSEVYKVTPSALASASEDNVRDAIQVAGLQGQKARAIVALANAVLERFQGDLGRILTLETEEAREALMRLPGVGPKTADVVLLFSRGAAVFPIDTHIARVSKRLGFVPAKSSYEEKRRILQALFRPEEYGQAHLLLIQLGRTYCTSVNPRHEICPVRDHCPKLMDCL
ncbi:MAG: endonuclease III [Candidatus Bathyarchaeia archaeon]